MGVVGGVFGVFSIVFGFASKNLSGKVSKHEQTVAIAKSKLNTINDLVSKALKDNEISDQEFSIILAELEKFQKLKQEIRQKFRKDSEKNFDMSIIRKKVREDLLKELVGEKGLVKDLYMKKQRLVVIVLLELIERHINFTSYSSLI